MDIKQLGTETAQFAKDIETEAKRITWPARPEAIKSTIAVIVISGIFAAFLAGVDSVFAWLVRMLLS